MRQAIVLGGIVVVLGLAPGAGAQPQPSIQHIVGDQISAKMNIDMKAGVMAETATLRFQSRTGDAVYTIDFIAHHPVNEPVASPGVVDIVVTQHPVEDDAPDMLLRVDGETVPIVTRLHSKRSVAATVSLAEFDRIAAAGVVVDRTFNTELELGAGQLKMLRATADRWLGRVR
jgi:hypothetical protein